MQFFFGAFLDDVASTFDLPKEDLYNELESAFLQPFHVTITLIDDKDDKVDENNVVKNVVKQKTDQRCVYHYTKSGRFFKKGEQCKQSSVEGEPFCKKHAGEEIDHIATPAKGDATKSVDDFDNLLTKMSDLKIKDDTEKVKKEPIQLKLNYQVGRFVHYPTSMVFFSKDERYVVARLTKAGTLSKLDENDINVCKQYGFRVNVDKFNEL